MIAAAGTDAAVILLAALLSGLVYQRDANTWDTVASGLFIALLFLGTNLLRRDYAIPNYLTLKGHAERAASAWIIAFSATLTLGFLTKTSAIFSRGATAILFVAGFVLVTLCRNALVRHMRVKAEAGELTARTIMLVGQESDILGFIARHRPARCGLRVIGAAVLRQGRGTLHEDLALAVATARMQPPDDVVLLLPWDEPDLVGTCVDAVRRLPAAIHLGPTPILERYGDTRIDQSGPISSVNLVRSPLSPMEVAAKRAFDLVGASAALLLLGPILMLAALAVALDSRGPILFLQRRYGFNQQPFRIIKFRSMSTMEDGPGLQQVKAGDSRVTRVGRVLRKTSIDELPQLLNVLAGDMSLVGPRPHALAHDQLFERTIAVAARRHNVKPGITGWAQVRGWRGETDTPEKIQARIEHDLHYIDNWSIWFDLSILLRTVLSPQTFRNAR